MLWMTHVLMVMHRKLRRKRGAVGVPLWLGPSFVWFTQEGSLVRDWLSSCVSCGTRRRCAMLRDVSVECEPDLSRDRTTIT